MASYAQFSSAVTQNLNLPLKIQNIWKIVWEATGQWIENIFGELCLYNFHQFTELCPNTADNFTSLWMSQIILCCGQQT